MKRPACEFALSIPKPGNAGIHKAKEGYAYLFPGSVRRVRTSSVFGSVGLAAVLVVLFVGTAAAMPLFETAPIARTEIAKIATQTYQYLVGVDPLCELAPDACPDVSRASSGETVEITGSGSFTVFSKSVTGSGNFTHKAADGTVVAKGTWEAVQLLSFQSYGSAAAQGLPKNLWGGKVLIRVQLFVGGNPVFTGILRVTCMLGDQIPPSAMEGVRLAVQTGPNFNKEVSGLTVFIKA
jgi:hypothetical protein